ncbi:MAG: Gx transporter family protein [Candidatus Poribacteria bacterium]
MEENNIYKIAFWVSISCVLQIAESLIPHPIPGLRLGLANVITLIVLFTIGWKSAIEVTFFRTILSSFIMGTFMSPAFIMSFFAGIVSALIMALFYRLSCLSKSHHLSIVGISILGAIFHNITQMYIAYFVLVKHSGIFLLFPWLCIGAVFAGWITGVIAGKVCLRLKEIQKDETMNEINTDYSSFVLRDYVFGNSYIHRLPVEMKIAFIFILSLAVLILNNLWIYAGLFVMLVIIILASQIPVVYILSKIKKYSTLLLISFLFPIFVNYGNSILFRLSYINITIEGIKMGFIFAMRIILLIIASSILSRTTSPEDLTKGLIRILSPLLAFRISSKKMASILSLSWVAVPVFWEIAKNNIYKIDWRKAKNIRNLMPLISDFIVTLYLDAESLSKSWEENYMISAKKD